MGGIWYIHNKDIVGVANHAESPAQDTLWVLHKVSHLWAAPKHAVVPIKVMQKTIRYECMDFQFNDYKWNNEAINIDIEYHTNMRLLYDDKKKRTTA